MTVAFKDTSTPGSAAITAWAWNFGDTETSTVKNPTHTYANAGMYTVTLTVTTSVDSDTETRANYVIVGKVTPSVTAWPTASPIGYGQTLAASTLSGGTASVDGTFSFTAPDTIPPAIGTYVVNVTFTPTSVTNYFTVSGTVTVTVDKVTPNVTAWPTASPITYGQTLASSTLSGGIASVPGTFAFTAPATTPDGGTYSAAVTFTPTNTANCRKVSGSTSVTVNKATPSVTTWPTASPITYGQTLASSILTGGTASVTGTFAFTAPASAPNVGSYTAAVTFTPASTTNYTTASGTVKVTVGKGIPSVMNWPTASPITYGQTLASSTLTGGTAAVPGTFSFTASTTTPNAGTYAASVTFTPMNTTNYNPALGSVSVTVNKAAPSVSTWPTASPITYGQTLASSILTGGSASVAGTFSFDTATTAPDIGTHTALLTFTPTSSSNYSTVSGSVSVTVNKANPSITAWPTAGNIEYGQTLASSTLSGGTASVSGAFAFTTPATIPNTGTYAANVTFTPADTTHYSTVSGTVTVFVRNTTGSAWFVKPGATGDGTSWGSALASIQDAVDGAFANGGGEIWVAAGTYVATTDPVVTMEPHVDIYGGFAGTETARAKRDWETNKTIIDGGGTRRCVIGANDAILNGFIVQKAYAKVYGGGIYNTYASPTITNCIFTENTAYYGGGMYNTHSSPTVANCTFFGNTANFGGGMYNAGDSPTVTGCTFSNNTATGDLASGGGMHNLDSTSAVTNCVFIGNTATGYECGGGGMCNEMAWPVVTNCTFTKNSAEGDYKFGGGGMYNKYYSCPTVTNCIFWGDSVSSSVDEFYNSTAPGHPSIPVVTYSCIQGGFVGTGNISSDPLLIGTPDSNGHIRPNSPCIDAGTSTGAPSMDIRGVVRLQGIGVDMGAYELDDSDGDGISDTWEQTTFGNLTTATADSDADGDDSPDLEESLYGSDPFDQDSDNDGFSDGNETVQGWDPMVPTILRRVNCANTSGVSNGLSWSTAFTTIQEAIDAVYSAGQGEVWVAGGTYTATTDSVLVMKMGVRLYGGFAGGEIIRSMRDWDTNKTIVDGQSARRCVYGANIAKLDGFILQNGYATFGGGMYNSSSYLMEVTNCIFAGNTAVSKGGGMYNNWYSPPEISNCTFDGNTAPSGGGMYNNSFSSPLLTNCTFTKNTASGGAGGMYNYFSSSPKVTNCIFTENTAASGGGMYNNSFSSPLLTNCTFTKNTASGGAGGIYNYFSSSPTLANCIFWADSASYSGNEFYNYVDAEHPSTPVVTYSCVQGGYTGTGNIATDPLFVDAANDDLRLTATSPCINIGTATGAPSTDILGVARPQGAGYDMGAYEYAGK